MNIGSLTSNSTSDLRDNPLIHKAYTEFLLYNSVKAECYAALLTVKYGK